jgi:hypothetical protein
MAEERGCMVVVGWGGEFFWWVGRECLFFSELIFKLKRCVLVMSISRAALDAEMRKCVAELRMLGSESTEASEFNEFLNEISNGLKALHDAVPPSNINTKLAALLLEKSVTRAVDVIVNSKIHTDKGWVKCLKAMRNVSEYAGTTLKTLSVIVHPDFSEICDTIESSLRTDPTYQLAGAEPRKRYIRTRLNSLGQNLARLDEQRVYNFLDEAPRKILRDLIVFLRR